MDRDKILNQLVEKKLLSRAQAELIAGQEEDDASEKSRLIRLLEEGQGDESTLKQLAESIEAGLPEEQNRKRFGKYNLIEELGIGGSGTVFKAYDSSLKRYVALKLLNIVSSRNLARLKKEAEVIAKLQHPNIVPIHELGSIGGTHFIAFQYIKGSTLAKAAAHMTRHEILRLFLQLCDAVSYAHKEGVIHRDIKPENILVDANANAYILDFEIAKELDSIATLSTEIAGTPAYMSPEQIKKEEIDERTDVYSLGATLYFCITNLLPFDGTTALEIIQKVIDQEPASPSRVDSSMPKGLELIIGKAMQKKREFRYQGVEQLRSDIERYLSDTWVEGIKIPLAARIRSMVKDKNYNIILILLIMLLAASGAYIYITWSGDARAEENNNAWELARSSYESAVSKAESIFRIRNRRTSADIFNILKGAIAELEISINHDGTFADPHLQKGIILFHLGLAEQAEESFTRAIELDPQLGSAYLERVKARFIIVNNKIDNQVYSDTLVDRMKEDINRFKPLEAPAPLRYYAEAIDYMIDGEDTTALKHLRIAEEHDPTFEEIFYFKAIILLKTAGNKSNDKKRDELTRNAYNQLRTCLNFNPINIIYIRTFILTCAKLGEYEKGLREAKWALKINPLDPTNYVYEAIFHMLLDQPGQAEFAIDQSYGIEEEHPGFPKTFSYYFNRGYVNLYLERDNLADTDLRHASEVASDENRTYAEQRIKSLKQKFTR